jgi:hypothetical protein
MKQTVTYRSRLLMLPHELRDELGEVSLQKGMLPTSRRDKINELFSKYHIEYRSIGTGTNRHIVKYDGYVIKIALDKEGIADNRQEWVMSDQLAPHVASTFEISDGGHLLVAEYAPAFSSYSEMMLRRDSISQILSNWCQRFLIGDVGIVDKNYANWGVNSQGKAVCIDYAYIFPVSMDLFHCLTCGCKTMVMNSTFSEYRCQSCNAVYPDSSLRSTITQQDRLRLFNTIEGVHLTEPTVTMEVDVDPMEVSRNNPDAPDPYKTSMNVANMILNRNSIVPFSSLV